MTNSTIQPRIITSPQNPHYKRWTSLLEARGISRYHQCLVSGGKIVNETLEKHPALGMEILGQKDNLPPPQSTPHLTRFVLPSNLFKALDVMGTHSPLLICRISDFPLFDLTTPPQGLEVLCPFGDPRNVGSIMRSCLAFGVAKLILLKEAAHPFHPNAIRSSSGAVFDQKIYRGPALPELNQEDVLRWIVALDLQGEDLTTWHWPSNVRLLIGEEGLGQPALHFRKKVTIRHSKDIHSLNATVAGTIALFSYRRLFPIRCP